MFDGVNAGPCRGGFCNLGPARPGIVAPGSSPAGVGNSRERGWFPCHDRETGAPTIRQEVRASKGVDPIHPGHNRAILAIQGSFNPFVIRSDYHAPFHRHTVVFRDWDRDGRR